MISMVVVTVYFVASWYPSSVDILKELLVLESRLFLELGEKYGPRDKPPSVCGPMEFLVDVSPKAVLRVGFMRKRSREELMCWPWS